MLYYFNATVEYFWPYPNTIQGLQDAIINGGSLSEVKRLSRIPEIFEQIPYIYLNLFNNIRLWGRPDVMKYLLELPLDSNVITDGYILALAHAAIYGRLDLMNLLLELPRVDEQIINGQLNSVLTLSTQENALGKARDSTLGVMSRLLDIPQVVEKIVDQNPNILFDATQSGRGNLEKVKRLLEVPQVVELLDIKGTHELTVLQMAQRNGFDEIAKLISEVCEKRHISTVNIKRASSGLRP